MGNVCVGDYFKSIKSWIAFVPVIGTVFAILRLG